MCVQILIIIGLLLSLFGTYMLYKSIFARGPYYGIDGSNVAFKNAVINIVFARIGFVCIFIGILFQITAVAIPLFITI